MSQRNRIVFVVVALVAALTVAVPAPSQAAGLRGESLPVVDAWERAWQWLVRLVGPGEPASSRRIARRDKEGSRIDPDGSPKPGAVAPAPGTSTSEEGGRIDPDGAD
jgi:hypothetical protein